MSALHVLFFFFFFNDTATTEIYTLSLHDALPISTRRAWAGPMGRVGERRLRHQHHPLFHLSPFLAIGGERRSEEHTSELQSQFHLVCRLLLEKKKKKKKCKKYI